MDNTPLNRAYLETLATTDLVQLADDYGIDIPEGLNRRFIIGELLEMAEEARSDQDLSGALAEAEFTNSPEILPETYNETQITVLLRDPGWVFVCWDFQTNLYTALSGNHHFESFFLRINSLSSAKPAAVIDFFDIDVGPHDRKWYVHLSGHAPVCRVDLCCRNSQAKEEILIRSAELVLPCACTADPSLSPKKRNPPLVDLSGIGELRKNHFRNHRQSFD